MTKRLFIIITTLLIALPATAEETVLIKEVLIQGDTSFLPEPMTLNTVKSGFEGKSMDEESIEARIKHINSILLNEGYYLAQIEANYDRIQDGTLILSIDQGRIGNINFFRLPGEYRGTDVEERKKTREPYRGYFSDSQLRPRFKPGRRDPAFNYNQLHREIFSINSLPDITLNTDLTIREEADQRYMDIDFYVEDQMPVHGILEFKNTGTQDTDEERITFTAQHLNLTKRDDTLTVELLTSLDLETLRNGAASYNVPYAAGKGGGISLFGGYSDLSVDNIVSGIDLAADGWHVGNRNFHHLIDNDHYTLNIAYGLLVNELSDSLEVRNGEQVKTEIMIAPASVGLVFNNNRPDSLNGRNFATLLYSYNLGDAFGITEQEEVEELRPDAKANYSHVQLQASRIQSLGGRIDANSGDRIFQHYLFGNIDLQYAGQPLISSEKKAVGGLETTRGYPENFVAGDNGITSTVEFRTLIFKGAFSRYLARNKSIEERRRLTADYVQFNSFFDYAYVEDEDTGDLVGTDQTLYSVGAGIRFALTGNSQVKVDYGYPLEKVEGVSGNGRFHFAIEAQF